MKHACTALVLSLALGAQGQTDNCDGIKLQIEGRMRAGGLANPLLVVVAAGSSKAGRVVGSCGNGTRQIVFSGGSPVAAAAPTAATSAATAATAAAPAATAAAAAADKIPTECKDGSVVIGPNCDDPRAFRMSNAEIAASATPAAKPASQ